MGSTMVMLRWLKANAADIVHYSSRSENSPSSLVVYRAAKNKSSKTEMLPWISWYKSDRSVTTYELANT